MEAEKPESAGEIAVIRSGARGLIKPTEEEELLKELEGLKTHKLNAREKKAMDETEDRFICALIKVSWRVFGLPKENLQQLDEKKLRALARLCERRTRARRWLTMAIALSIPVIGWGVWLGNRGNPYDAPFWALAHNYRKLRVAYGENYSPYARLKEHPELVRDCSYN